MQIFALPGWVWINLALFAAAAVFVAVKIAAVEKAGRQNLRRSRFRRMSGGRSSEISPVEDRCPRPMLIATAASGHDREAVRTGLNVRYEIRNRLRPIVPPAPHDKGTSRAAAGARSDEKVSARRKALV